MRWTISKDIIVCKYYFKIRDGKYEKYVKQINQELVCKGFKVRTESSIVKKPSNFEYLHTGKGGLPHYSKQNETVFLALK